MEILKENWLIPVMVFLVMVILWAYGQSKKFKSGWARPLILICTVLILGLAGTHMYKIINKADIDGQKIRDKELTFLAAAMQTLGDELGKNRRNSKILLITYEPTEFNKLQTRQDLVVSALNQGLAGRGEIGAVVHPKHEAFADAVEESMITAEMLNEVIAENPGHQIILSMVGLPHDYQEMDLWKADVEDDARPRLALHLQSVYELQGAIAADFIAAAVIYKPGYRFQIDGPPAPELYTDAFAERYLLVTPHNVEELAETHENMFFIPEEEE